MRQECLGAKPIDTPLDPKVKFDKEAGELLNDPEVISFSDADWAGVYVGKSISCCCSGLGSKKDKCGCDIIYRPITGNSHDMWDFVGENLFLYKKWVHVTALYESVSW